MFIKLLKNSLVVFVCSMGAAFAGEIEDNLKKSCDSDNYSDCGILGVLIYNNPSLKDPYYLEKGDKAAIVKSFTKACDGGYARGCLSLSLLYNNETFGVMYNNETFDLKMSESELRSESIELLRKACNTGEALGCVALGSKYESGSGVKKDYHKAVSFFTQACNAGETIGCVALGWMYDTGKGVKQSKSKAMDIFRESCALENSWMNWGCTVIEGKTKKWRSQWDLSSILDLYEDVILMDARTKACDMGDADNCYNLGKVYAQQGGGAYVKESPNKVVELYTKACDMGHSDACVELGMMYENGNVVRENGNKALDMYSKACDLKDEYGCEAYVRLTNEHLMAIYKLMILDKYYKNQLP